VTHGITLTQNMCFVLFAEVVSLTNFSAPHFSVTFLRVVYKYLQP
jgi:hypothetical protein